MKININTEEQVDIDIEYLIVTIQSHWKCIPQTKTRNIFSIHTIFKFYNKKKKHDYGGDGTKLSTQKTKQDSTKQPKS